MTTRNNQQGFSSRLNEEKQAENDRRGIDNPQLNRDQGSSFDKDRDSEDEDDDDFLSNDIDENLEKTKRNQKRTGTDTNPK